MLLKKTRNRAIATTVLNNPVPYPYTDQSLELLEAIIDCKSDEVVRSKPITLYLNRKWNAFAYHFYLFNFVMFVTLLLALTFMDTYTGPIAITLFSTAAFINVYFLFYELIQMCIQKLDYFTNFNNIMDVTRLTLMFMILVSKAYTIFSV